MPGAGGERGTAADLHRQEHPEGMRKGGFGMKNKGKKGFQLPRSCFIILVVACDKGGNMKEVQI